jgi:hypothetical protein
MTDDEILDPTTRDELIAWLQILYEQVYDLRLRRSIFETMRKMIDKNPELQGRPSHVYAWLYDLYLDGMAIAVRRMCDEDDRTVSLVRFLNFVKREPSVVSRSAYGAMFEKGSVGGPGLPEEAKELLRQGIVDRAYDEAFGKGVDQPRGKDIRKEIRELRGLGREVIEYADKRVAHFDKKPPTSYPSIEAIDVFLAKATELIKKYTLFLKAVSTDMGIYFQYDWLAPFRVPWLPTELEKVLQEDEAKPDDVWELPSQTEV